MALIWFALALVFAVVEVATASLVAGFLAVGALAAAIAAFAGAGVPIQIVAFGAVSVLGVLAVRRPLLRVLKARHNPDLRSGAWSMIGESAVVVDPIGGPGKRGHVRIAGEDWPAVTADGAPVVAGTTVQIVDITRATLVVAPPAPIERGEST